MRINLPIPIPTCFTLIDLILGQLGALLLVVHEDRIVAAGKTVDPEVATVADGLQLHFGFGEASFGVGTDAAGGEGHGVGGCEGEEGGKEREEMHGELRGGSVRCFFL